MATYTINAHVFHALGFAPPNTAVAGATVQVFDRDVVGGDDQIFSGTTDSQGFIGGTTSDSNTWLEPAPNWAPPGTPGDIARIAAVVTQGNNTVSFPCVLAGGTIGFPPMFVPWGPGAPPLTACNLPAPVADLRRIALKGKKGLYRWGYDLDPEIANCKDPIPPEENNPPRFTAEYLPVVAKVGKARLRVANSEWTADPFDNLDDFAKFFPPFKKPAVLDRIGPGVVLSDRDFADQRLAGANPMMLKRVFKDGDIPAGFGGGFDALRTRTLGVKDIRVLLDQRTLFMCDYEILGTPATTGSQYMPTPFALFGVIGGKLEPIAIQIERDFHATLNPVFTPVDPNTKMWDIAKLMVQVADFCVHEMKYHLYECHLAMEPFAVAAARNLALDHPLLVLLKPHFQGMIFKNSQARNYLVADFGPVAKIISQTTTADKDVVKRAAAAWRFDRAGLPAFLARRGLDDPATLPDYPFRDDGLLIWKAIQGFVTDYVGHCYPNDGAVHEDTGCDQELKDFFKDLRSSTGGKVKGLPKVTKRAELVDILTQVIFTCSAQHSAVNFAQYDYFAFVPNQPGGAWARPLPSAGGPGETELRKILPHAAAALEQTHLIAELALYRYDRLGRYDVTFYEPWATDVRKFQQQLAQIDTTIQQRNDQRRPSLKYEYLKPMNVINSISV